MKKKVLLLLLICVCLVGCGKKKSEPKKVKVEQSNTPKVGGWTADIASEQATMTDDDRKVFEDATKNYKDIKLEVVALLGRKIDSTMKYVFLSKGTVDSKTDYRIVVTSKDANGKVELLSVEYFDVTEYVNKNTESESTILSGGWLVNVPPKNTVLTDELQAKFDKATETITGVTYQPIALLAHQVVSGTNYAILAYGKPSLENGATNQSTAVYVLTLYEDLEGKQEITNAAFVDITVFDK